MHISPPKQAVIIGSLFFLLYGVSTTSTPTGIADADELTLTSFFLSVPHPPGFPLFTLIGHIGIKTFSAFTNPAHAANITSALFMSIAIAFLLLTNYRLIFFLRRQHHIEHPSILAWGSTILMGCSYFIWHYATIFEITSFTALLASIALYSALSWYIAPKPQPLFFYLTWIATGLLLAHFHLALVYLPAFLVLLITKKQASFKTCLIGCLSLMAAIIATSLLLLILNQQTAFSWNFPPTLTGVWRHVTRQDYVGIDVESNITYKSAFSLPNIFNASAFHSVMIFFSLLIAHFNPIVFIIAILGASFLFRYYRSLFWFFLLLFSFSGPFLAAYMHIADYTFETNLLTGIAVRQFILAEIALSLFLIPGITLMKHVVLNTQHLVAPGIMLLCIYQIVHNSTILLNHQDREVNYTYLKHNLQAAAPNALIICSTDIDCYGLWYQSLIEGIRPDITVLAHIPIYRQQFLSSNYTIYPFSLHQNPHYLQFLIANNVSTRPIYLTSGIGFYDKYLGMEDGPLFLLPQHNMFLLSPNYPDNPEYQPLPTYVASIAATLDQRNLYARGIIEAIANNQAYAGYLMLKYRQNNIAGQYLHTAQSLDPSNPQTRELINNQDAIIQVVAIDNPHMNDDTLIKQAKEASANQQLDHADQAYRYAILIGGRNSQTINAAIDFYTQRGDLNTVTYLRELLLYNNSVPE